MRRPLARHAFTALSLLSLLLCVAVCGLWVRSYSYWDHCDAPAGPKGYWTCGSFRGLIAFQWAGTFTSGTTPYGNVYSTKIPPAGPWIGIDSAAKYHFLGFSFDPPVPPDTKYRTPGVWQITVPHAAVVVGAAALPSLWTLVVVRKHRLKRRREKNLCPQCGYDLRASPDRCPECGAGRANEEGGMRNAE